MTGLNNVLVCKIDFVITVITRKVFHVLVITSTDFCSILKFEGEFIGSQDQDPIVHYSKDQGGYGGRDAKRRRNHRHSVTQFAGIMWMHDWHSNRFAL